MWLMVNARMVISEKLSEVQELLRSVLAAGPRCSTGLFLIACRRLGWY